MARLAILRKVLKDERGIAAVEYGLLLAMVVLAIIGALSTFAGETISLWDTVTNRTQAAMNQTH